MAGACGANPPARRSSAGSATKLVVTEIGPRSMARTSLTRRIAAPRDIRALDELQPERPRAGRRMLAQPPASSSISRRSPRSSSTVENAISRTKTMPASGCSASHATCAARCSGMPQIVLVEECHPLAGDEAQSVIACDRDTAIGLDTTVAPTGWRPRDVGAVVGRAVVDHDHLCSRQGLALDRRQCLGDVRRAVEEGHDDRDRSRDTHGEHRRPPRRLSSARTRWLGHLLLRPRRLGRRTRRRHRRDRSRHACPRHPQPLRSPSRRTRAGTRTSRRTSPRP